MINQIIKEIQNELDGVFSDQQKEILNQVLVKHLSVLSFEEKDMNEKQTDLFIGHGCTGSRCQI